MISLTVDDEIKLYPLEEHYTDALFELVDQSRDYLRRWQNWPDRIRTRADMRDLIHRSQLKAEHGDGLDMVICYKGEPAGKIGLSYINWKQRQAEIGYWLAEVFEGRGLVTRSCRTLVNYALTRKNLRQVRIRCAVGNTRSRAIPERLGFDFRGVLPYKTTLHGQALNEVLYVMTARNWKRQMIYHIAGRDEWEAAQSSGQYRTPSLETQGFIHFSGLDQVTQVANALYKGQNRLVLLCVDTNRLRSKVKYEPPDLTARAERVNGERFPHLYGALNTDAVVRIVDFPPRDDGTFALPDDL